MGDGTGSKRRDTSRPNKTNGSSKRMLGVVISKDRYEAPQALQWYDVLQLRRGPHDNNEIGVPRSVLVSNVQSMCVSVLVSLQNCF